MRLAVCGKGGSGKGDGSGDMFGDLMKNLSETLGGGSGKGGSGNGRNPAGVNQIGFGTAKFQLQQLGEELVVSEPRTAAVD